MITVILSATTSAVPGHRTAIKVRQQPRMLAAMVGFIYFCVVSYIDQIKLILQELKPELARRFYVSSIGLFGSIVRDDFSPSKSDIDIIVDFSKPVGIEFIDLADYLESKMKRKVDLVSKNGIKKNYFDQIESEIIYV